MLYQLSKQLSSRIDDVINNATSNIMKIDYIISISDYPDIVIENTILEEISIDQNFEANYMDDIELVVSMHPAEYVKLIEHHQDITISLKFLYIDHITNQSSISKLPEIYQYKGIIKNTKDLSKQFHISSYQNKDTSPQYDDQIASRINVVFQLLEVNAYNLRHQQFNGMFSKVTVKQVIEYITAAYGIVKLSLIEPDNTTVYDHIIIPPGHDFSSLFTYLQNRYGVYFKGLTYYYTNGVLYIYPPYEVNPNKPKSLNLYNVPQNQYAGLEGYHTYKNEDIHVVSNTPTDTINLSELGQEEVGNATSFIRADTMLDMFQEYKGSRGVDIKNKNTVTAETTTKKGMMKNLYYQKYRNPTINIFKETSRLEAINATVLVLGWVHSTWFEIEPGHKTIYHYDDDGRYDVRTGLCNHIKYEFTCIGRVNEYIFDCSATLSIRLEQK